MEERLAAAIQAAQQLAKTDPLAASLRLHLFLAELWREDPLDDGKRDEWSRYSQDAGRSPVTCPTRSLSSGRRRGSTTSAARSELVAACCRDGAGLHTFCDTFGIDRAYTSADQLLADADPN